MVLCLLKNLDGSLKGLNDFFLLFFLNLGRYFQSLIGNTNSEPFWESSLRLIGIKETQRS